MKLYAEPDDARQPGVKQFELEEWIDTSPFEQMIGACIECAEAGKARLSLPFTVKLANGGGVMHGGALTTLADTAVAMAIKSLLPAGTQFATTDLSMKFLAPVKNGIVTAHASVETEDNVAYHGECELRGDEDQRYATFNSIFKVLSGR